MDPTLLIVLLVLAMTVSGGLLGGFAIRAVINMRNHIISSVGEIDRLAEVVADLRGQIEGLRQDHRELHERLDFAERLLGDGDKPRGVESDHTVTPQ